MMPAKDSVLKFRSAEYRCCLVTSHEQNLLPISTLQSYALLSAESKATQQAANNKEMLDECHDIVWCHTMFDVLCVYEKKREAREDRVNFRSACRPAGMSRHNQQRRVEEVSSLLGGTHAMKSVKPSIDIIEGLSTGVKMDASAPHLIHKWSNESRQSPSSMLGGLVKRKLAVTLFFAPHALACRRNLWRDLKILVPLRLAALEPPSKSYANLIVQSFLCNSLEIGVIKRPMRTG